MATVLISEYEIRRQLLPAVCMHCGDNSTVWQKQQFSWTPPWIWICILGGLPGIIGMIVVFLVARKNMTVDVPLCDEHQNHFSRRRQTIAVGFFLLVIAVVVGIVALVENDVKGKDELSPWICFGLFVIGIVWWITAIMVRNSGIHPTKITDDDITLTKVAMEFEDALEDDRDRDEEEARERRAQQRARREQEYRNLYPDVEDDDRY